MYAIVDIETTGGHAESNGITEIAIFIHDGKKIVNEFSSLINPGFSIPPYISSYTGITNEMVENAPYFNEVAHEVFGLLKEPVFVAHNVNFDYSFIHYQLKQAGYDLKSKKLCTVRLSRRVFPGLRSYSLGNLCTARGISIHARHRARGDAEATVKLFEQILKFDEESAVMNEFLKKGSKEYALPPDLPREQFDELSEKPGVYYFYNEQGKIIYVGKAKNIKKRVSSHFSGNGTQKQKQDFFRNIRSVAYTECATELMALILESIEIKKHWPEFNRAQKQLDFAFGIYDYEDQNGYIRLGVDKIRKHVKALQTFRTQTEAFTTLKQLVEEYNLCPKLCFIDKTKDPCYCQGACEKKEIAIIYNSRLQEAIVELQHQPSFAIVDVGLARGEHSCILVENGRFYGMGYLPSEISFTSAEEIKRYIKPQKENFFINDLIKTENILTSSKCIWFDQAEIEI